jgi:Tfp pilus assembly protein PilX
MKHLPPRGFVFMDVLVGMLLVGMLGAMLGAAAAMEQRSIKHLDDTRAAYRMAEMALLSMSSGQSIPAGQSLHVRKLQNSAQVNGMNWVEVQASVHGCTSSLVGLVPAGVGQ